MTKKEELNKAYKELTGKDLDCVTLFIHMPTGETEVIVNPRVPEKMEYVNKTYNDDLVHPNCDKIYIEDYIFSIKGEAHSVTQVEIDKLIEEAAITDGTVYGKCTVMTIQLKNGFILTESSACVDKANYDYAMGKEICLSKIKDKLWELEGYKLQCELAVLSE